MTLSLEQVFFGRGSRGYAVLGNSPGARSLVARVEAICGSIGTPDGNWSGEPFLLSVPDRERVVMVCVRRGEPDGMGRSTLFFHALVAKRESLVAAEADAFALFERGAFADRMPSGPIEALPFEVKPGRDGSTSRPNGGRIMDASLPCVFRSSRPEVDLVRSAVADRALDLAWATYSFVSLSGFDVQVLPPRVSAPSGCNEYDSDGKLLRIRNKEPVEETRSRIVMSERHPNSPSRASLTGSGAPAASFALKVSLLANAALVALCLLLLAGRKADPPMPPQPTIRGDVSSLEEQVKDLQGETNRLAVASATLKRENADLKARHASASISEDRRTDIISEARKALIADIPTNDIDECLADLVGKDNAQKNIRDWLKTLQDN